MVNTSKKKLIYCLLYGLFKIWHTQKKTKMSACFNNANFTFFVMLSIILPIQNYMNYKMGTYRNAHQY